jgi:hypothetical protein
MQPLPLVDAQSNEEKSRWDKENLYDFSGSYGDYLLKKVSKVFPELSKTNLKN